MNTQLLHISFNFKGQVDYEALKKKFDLAIDWVHYMPSCWIVKTTSNAQKWYERLRPHIGPKDHLFICRVNINERQGWLPRWVWDWIYKNSS
jgi:hypothetical protein